MSSASDHIRDIIGNSRVRDELHDEFNLGRRAIRKLVNMYCDDDGAQQLVARSSSPEKIVDAFKSFAMMHQSKEVNNDVVALTDLRGPSQWYPLARSMKRHIVFHCGPTNSGKTHGALVDLEKADCGLYAGPLRLLAWQVYKRLQGNAVPCDLRTGQEIIDTPFARHKSATVEMTDVNSEVEVAVIDEIQMVGDPDRGHAFTRALLGAPAQTVYLCGDTSATSLIEEICEINDEQLTIIPHQRLGTLSFSSPVRSLKQLSRGDCLICFSRHSIHEMKKRVERETGLKACVVYGSLPPQARQAQATLFNDPDSGFDILIASDAIGMGLNLHIKRIIFTSLRKFDGQETRRLTVSEVLQIGGRAGRYGSEFPTGEVTCLEASANEDDVDFLREALKSKPTAIEQAGLTPEFSAIQQLSEAIPNLDYHEVIRQFQHHSTLDGLFFMTAKLQDLIELGEAIQQLPLTLNQRHTFAMAPVDLRTRSQVKKLTSFARQFTSHSSVALDLDPAVEAILRGTSGRPVPLEDLEELAAVVDIYIWLAYRFPREFREMEYADVVRQQIVQMIHDKLLISAPDKFKRQKHRRRR
ncbi:RNA helicase [Plasmodiophora brassicae]